VPSRDGEEIPLVEALRVIFLMIPKVGFAKSLCSTWSAFLEEPLFGVVGAVCEGEAAPLGSTLPVSGIKTLVTVPHRGNGRREGIGDMVEQSCGDGCDMRDACHGNYDSCISQEIIE
jgi:hypothetical protein